MTFGLIVAAPLSLIGQEVTDSYSLPSITVVADQVANQAPVATFAMPVSGLRFEPRVDVQSRNFAEAQADISIRGGIFENTGIQLGGISLYDPQTGHYLAEFPVAPAMLSLPDVRTGAANALAGLNAEVGSIGYSWRPIERRGELSLAAGQYNSNQQSIYQGIRFPRGPQEATLAADLEWSRSESDGSIPFGDHNFQRFGGRVQLRGKNYQTDLFGGRQTKFFGWPNLYTPFGFNETEDLETRLYVLNHRVALAGTGYWQVGASYRENHDDYEFNRLVPGASNPFLHTTRVTAVAIDGRNEFGASAVNYHVQGMRDSLHSTSLTFGRFQSRRYFKAAVLPEHTFAVTGGSLVARLGASIDDTNRDSSVVSPIVHLELKNRTGGSVYAEVAQTSQVPSYTALNSNATAGLFRGNPNLGRETSRNFEIGTSLTHSGFSVKAAVFYRDDHDLADWTFRQGVIARTASAVDIATQGAEIVAAWRRPRYEFVVGYTFLDKQSDYGITLVDASFYALNFAKHRLTAAATVRFGDGFELRLDNEYRVQEANLLRTAGGEHALLSSAGLYYLPPRIRGAEFSVLVENLWNSSFQEVPSVPAARRQISGGVAWRW